MRQTTSSISPGIETANQLAWLRTRIGELEQIVHERDGTVTQIDAALRQELVHREQTELVLRAIMEGTASEIDDGFFHSLVKHLAAALDVRYAFVSEFTDVRTRVRTLAFWKGDGFLENYEFDIARTPCEQVLQGYMRHYAQGVQETFPDVREDLARLGVESYLAIPMTDPAGQVLGHLSVMDVKPMPLPEIDLWVFKTFGARAGAELARKQAALKLRESEQRLARMFESAMDAIITIDDRHHVTLFNQAAAEVFRCDAGAALGQPFERFMSERFRHLLGEAVKEFERSGWAKHFLWGQGLTAMRSDGEAFPVDVSLSPFESQGKRHMTIILRDTLIRKRAEMETERLRSENARLQGVIQAEAAFPEVIGASLPMKKLLEDLRQVAPTDATVLITGETGTGKEIIARCIHQASARKDKPMIKVNCAALSPSLIESELLGHEKGAFTGAIARKAGRFELAHQGTIFLDEIGELPLDLQAKLLRVLQEGEFERVGGTVTQKVNVRVIAATNRDLCKAAQDGHFRSDLYYRLSVFPCHVAPLRERREDIAPFIHYFVARYAKQIGRSIDKVSRPVIDALSTYHWPGNVRELEHVIERGVILCSGSRLELGDWVPRARTQPLATPLKTLEAFEREHILEALRLTNWRVSGPKGAAAILGLKATTLEARMTKLAIKRPR